MDMGFTDFRAFEADESARRLRPLGWAELRARLAAASELRRVLETGSNAARPMAGASSFDAGIARLLLRGGGLSGEYGDPAVNPTSSAIGKAADSTTGGSEDRPPACPPETGPTRRVMP